MKSTAVTSDLKLQVCRKAFTESREPHGRSIAYVLGSIEDPLPDVAIRMLHWLATEHEDPDREAWQEDAGGGQTYYNGNIYTNGINTTRGRAAEAIRDLILNDAAYIDRFRATLDQMIRDPSASVLSCVAGTLRATAYRDPVLGLSLFQNMDPVGGPPANDAPCLPLHPWRPARQLCRIAADCRAHAPVVEPEVCEAGARLASIAVLEHESAADLADEASRGDARHRLGVAQVASANIAVPECRAWSEAKLAALFNDDDADVRRKAASCFRSLRDAALDTYDDLLAAFCDSRAYQEDSFSILHMLEDALGRLPKKTCVVCEQFLDRFADDARGVRTSRDGDTHTVTKLIFRTYQQHQNDAWTSRSLDLIDRLCLEGIIYAGHEFEQFER